MWKEAILTLFEVLYFPCICLEVMRENTEAVIRDDSSPDP